MCRGEGSVAGWQVFICLLELDAIFLSIRALPCKPYICMFVHVPQPFVYYTLSKGILPEAGGTMQCLGPPCRKVALLR